MILISIEFLVITVLIIIFFNEMYYNEWIFIYYIIFSVCERVIGLGVLINLIYIYGNQRITFLNLEW
jgi:NADH:ubiquinone oxidoreductase subunit K